MRSYLALVHKDPDSAFGLSFPDLPSVFSAADEEGDLIDKAAEALRLWAEDEELPEPTPIDVLLARPDLREELAQGAFLIRVPLIEDDVRVVRANVTFEAGTLRAIDAAAAKRGLTRSAFLASCARKEIERAG
ncbi:CopG family transcriptional regulator [Rhizobium rhizosphaerae]|uniref:CopG family transcriptional regulator n=1 Tax=Xaviernesmea rhizosphaerae TaxID=1672749 RepID=A0A1Q9AL81_9HYPH|nr:type II toxin-antitoxin system HicB family antitoxin [Xaviernesmea rhizosphaerae]OLP56057.1 CopG family transcriptional regulator [Xaviernesmea rhizosphaerae]OQP86852.1 CopG family transcriptional regulator [Xaviernesmea rhizosphaerae]